MDKHNKTLLVIALVLALVFSIFLAFALLGENPFRNIISIESASSEDINASITYIPHRYEVTDIYRMYNGYNLIYGVDYIDGDEIKTLVAPRYRTDATFNRITVHPSNTTYLIYLEEVQDLNKTIITIDRNENLYELYKSDDFVIQGVPTSYTRARQSDFHSTVIVT